MVTIQGRPVLFTPTDASRAIFESIVISRFAVDDKGDEVLRTLAGLAYVPRGTSSWQLSAGAESVLLPAAASQSRSVDVTPSDGPRFRPPDRTVVQAEWYQQHVIEAMNVDVRDGGNANVFQSFGVLFVPDGFRIPVVTANSVNVMHYGLSLIINDTNVVFDSPEYDLVLARYDYRPNYLRDFLTKERGGGGYFVETHNFPHLHTPLSAECGGCILVGQKRMSGDYEFTGFRIPYGTGLYTPSNTIHGDGTIVGDHAITVATASAQADTVLFYNENSRRMAPDAVAPM